MPADTLNLQPGFHENIDPEIYHRDEVCEVPTLSRSLAETLIFQSALHAFHAHPRLAPKAVAADGTEEEEDATPAMDFGTLGHKLLLGRGAKVAVGDFKDFKTKAAREWRDQARGSGFTPVLRKTYDKGVKMRECAEANLKELGIWEHFLRGTSEVVGIFDEGDVRCRVMFDRIVRDALSTTIYDIKITGSAHPRAIARQIENMNYDMQDASYRQAAQRLRPEAAGREKMVFLFIEESFPHCVTPVELDGEWKSAGTIKWNHAVHVWRQCRARNEWPPYVTKLTTLSPKEWTIMAAAGLKDPEFRTPAPTR